jgi:hypothetical protein
MSAEHSSSSSSMGVSMVMLCVLFCVLGSAATPQLVPADIDGKHPLLPSLACLQSPAAAAAAAADALVTVFFVVLCAAVSAWLPRLRFHVVRSYLVLLCVLPCMLGCSATPQSGICTFHLDIFKFQTWRVCKLQQQQQQQLRWCRHNKFF